MPTYKLIYFDARARAELSRFIFAHAGVKYEDKRISYQTEWPEYKPNTPFGVLPVLEVDGKQLGGSMIIARYLAEQYGLAGSNEFENAQIACIVDAVTDLFEAIVKPFFEKDETRKQELVKKLKDETLPAKLPLFEKRASTNDSGWLYNEKLTWADFAFYLMSDLIVGHNKEALEDFPGLKKLRASVEGLPNIAKWLEERPKTEY